jgi:Spy/CpxP family protein refolding chaperone
LRQLHRDRQPAHGGLKSVGFPGTGGKHRYDTQTNPYRRSAGGYQVLAGIIGTGALTFGVVQTLAQGLHFGRGFQPERFLKMATAVLDLNETQRTQVRASLDRHAETARPLLAQLRQTHQAMEQAENGQAGKVTLEPLAGQIGRDVAQLAMIKAKATGEIHAVLTPEQREKAETIHEQFRTRFRERWAERH